MSRLIDADVLIDKYGEWYTEEGTEEGYIGTVKGIVDSMPTIDTVRNGKWQYITDGHYEYFKCNQCERHSGEPTPFCRYCGAKMEEGEQDDE